MTVLNIAAMAGAQTKDKFDSSFLSNLLYGVHFFQPGNALIFYQPLTACKILFTGYCQSGCGRTASRGGVFSFSFHVLTCSSAAVARRRLH